MIIMEIIKEFDSKLFDTLSKSSNRVFFYCAAVKHNTARWSKSAVEYFGLPGEYLSPTSIWDERVHPDDFENYNKSFIDMFNHVTPYHNCEYRIKNAQGEYVWVNCRGYMNYDSNGEPEFFAGYVTNMGTINKVDVVTGLWTSYGFRNDATQLLEEGKSGAAVQIDITNFKRINSQFGYDFGDVVMYTIGQKLKSIVGEKSLYRMDGAQFAFLIEGGRDDVVKLRDKIADRISELTVNDIDLHIEFSCGATVFPEDGEFIDQIQSNLFHALSNSKHSGVGELVFFSQDLAEKRNKILRLGECLRRSIENDCEGFRIVFQPIIDKNSGELHSAEVLLRWSNAEFTHVGPVEFIPILEETRGIIPVGKWIIDKAFSYVAEWNRTNNVHKLKHVNINFSYIQFKDKTLKDYVVQKLDEYGLPHNTLIAELTESCRVECTGKFATLLQEYRDEGIIIALDDFGTGYASLALLKDMPADIVKLDHSMTRTIADREKDRNLVEFIISYCNKMNIDVCTEGVETGDIVNIVSSAGTQYMQGYYYDKPLEANEFFEKYIL
jgi:diguanylate cyclase (GGDEF)-like protein